MCKMASSKSKPVCLLLFLFFFKYIYYLFCYSLLKMPSDATGMQRYIVGFVCLLSEYKWCHYSSHCITAVSKALPKANAEAKYSLAIVSSLRKETTSIVSSL